jgi:outer membrane protein assembly factor BamB
MRAVLFIFLYVFIDEPVFSQTSAIAKDGTVYSVDGYGHLTGTSSTGQVLWRITNSVSDSHFVMPVLDGSGNLFVTYARTVVFSRYYYDFYCGIFAIDPFNATIKWTFEIHDQHGSSNAVLDQDHHLVFKGHVFDSGSGQLLFTLPQSSSDSAAIFGPNGVLYIKSKRLEAVDLRTRAYLWVIEQSGTPEPNTTVPAQSFLTTPVIGPSGTLYAGMPDHRVLAVDSITGQIKWLCRTLGPVYTTGILDQNEDLYIASSDGRYYAFRGRTGELKWFFDSRFGSQVSYHPPILTSSGAIHVWGQNQNGYPRFLDLAADSGAVLSEELSDAISRPLTDNNLSFQKTGPPEILTEPQIAPLVGGSAIFGVNATGTQPLSYQWFKNGIRLPDATNFSYMAAAPAMNDEFQAQITNILGSTNTMSATPGYTLTTRAFTGKIRASEAAAFKAGSVVHLQAVPPPNRRFLRWNGDASGTNTSLDIEMDHSKFITAEFETEDLDFARQIPIGSRLFFNGRTPFSLAAGADGIVYAATLQQLLLAFDTYTGRELWSYWRDGINLQGLPPQIATTARGNVVFSIQNLSVDCLDGRTGKLRWSRSVTNRVSTALDPRGIVYIFAGDVTAVDEETGVLISKQPLAATYSGFIHTDGKLFFSQYPVGWSLYNPGPDFSIVVRPGIFQALQIRDGVTDSTKFQTSDFIGPVTPEPRIIVSQNGNLFAPGRELDWLNSEIKSISPVASSSVFRSDGTLFSNPLGDPFLFCRFGVYCTITNQNLTFFASLHGLMDTIWPSESFDERNSRCLLILGKPRILTQPRNHLTTSTNQPYFYVDATGTPPLSYQWFRNGMPISNGTTSRIRPSSTNPADTYFVRIRNLEGETDSRTVGIGLTVEPIQLRNVSDLQQKLAFDFPVQQSFVYFIESTQFLESPAWNLEATLTAETNQLSHFEIASLGVHSFFRVRVASP